MTLERISILAVVCSSAALLLALSSADAQAQASASASGSGGTSNGLGHQTEITFHIVETKKGLANGSANVQFTVDGEEHHIKVALDCLRIGQTDTGHFAVISGVVIASDAPDYYAEDTTVMFTSWDDGEGKGKSIEVDSLTPLYSLGDFYPNACDADLVLVAFAETYEYEGGNVQIELPDEE